MTDQGSDGFNVERVPYATAVNKSRIYRRWTAKGAQITAALTSIQNDVVAELPDSASLRTDLKYLGLAVADTVKTAQGRELLRAVIGADEIPELAAYASPQIAAGMGSPVAAIFKRAAQRGELSPKAPVELLLTMLGGGVIHRIFLE